MAKKLRNLRLNELSLVDFPANKHARVTIFKRADVVAQIIKDMEAMDFEEVAAEREAMEVAYSISDDIWRKWNDLQTSFGTIACDDALSAEQKIAAMQSSLNQFVAALDEVPGMQKALAKRFEASAALAVLKVGEPDTTHDRGRDMPPDLKADVDRLTRELAEMTKQRDESQTALAALTKQAADSEAARKAAEQAAELAKKDEIIKIGETEVRKSVVGEASFAIIKAQDEQLRVERDKRESADFEKRASAEVSNLPGTAVEKGAVLKAVEGLPEATRKTLGEMLKAGDAAMKANVLKEHGAGGVPPASADSAQAKLDAAVKKYAEDNKVTVEKATTAVMATADGTRLYNEARIEKRNASRAA